MKLNSSDFIEVIKKTPLVSIDLIVRNEMDEILLGLRKNEPARNFWFIPGGRILVNERIAQAFKRILHEELGIRSSIENATFLGVYEHFYQSNFAQESGFGTHYIVLAYEMTASSAIENFPKDQHHNFKWMKVEQLIMEDDVHPNTKGYFR